MKAVTRDAGGPPVKCPSCGTENPESASQCRVCKRQLVNLSHDASVRGEAAKKVGTSAKERIVPSKAYAHWTVDHRTIPDKMKFDYTHGLRDHTQKNLEGVQTLLSHFQDPHIDIDKLLDEAATLIWRQFGIDNVAIGLKDPKDGLYKYKAMAGFRPDALEAHKKITYKKEQFLEDGEFHGFAISKYTRIYLTEDNRPLEGVEKDSYNRPALLTIRRTDSTDSLEGDYIDVGIYGPGEELVGWIEISGTRTMKLPDVTTIRWVEVMASIIAVALVCSKAH